MAGCQHSIWESFSAWNASTRDEPVRCFMYVRDWLSFSHAVQFASTFLSLCSPHANACALPLKCPHYSCRGSFVLPHAWESRLHAKSWAAAEKLEIAFVLEKASRHVERYGFATFLRLRSREERTNRQQVNGPLFEPKVERAKGSTFYVKGFVNSATQHSLLDSHSKSIQQ